MCRRACIHTPEQRHLQELLRRKRLEDGFTQVELADRLHTPHSRISDYERGERRMDLVQLFDYCKTVGIKLKDFVAEFENSLPPSAG